MRESEDATIITKIAEYAPYKPSLSVILGLDPRTHNSKVLKVRVHLTSLTMGPRVKPEDDGERWFVGRVFCNLCDYRCILTLPHGCYVEPRAQFTSRRLYGHERATTVILM
ncbi:hypothetical protein FHW17_002956 [Phyllobacterium sp. P30BS-XVII]|nr:hypothetical protein [Phyllobacterium sp. P30BS-XVII]